MRKAVGMESKKGAGASWIVKIWLRPIDPIGNRDLVLRGP